MIKTTNLNYNVEKEYYIIPRYKLQFSLRNSVDETLNEIEDFKLNDLTEKSITEKIKEYNIEYEMNFFNRLKAKDFTLLEVKTIKIGKYKFSKIAALDNTK